MITITPKNVSKIFESTRKKLEISIRKHSEQVWCGHCGQVFTSFGKFVKHYEEHITRSTK